MYDIKAEFFKGGLALNPGIKVNPMFQLTVLKSVFFLKIHFITHQPVPNRKQQRPTKTGAKNFNFFS